VREIDNRRVKPLSTTGTRRGQGKSGKVFMLFKKRCLLLLVGLFFINESITYGQMFWKGLTEFPIVKIQDSTKEIPPFYFWQKIYKTKGKNPFLLKLMTKNGTFVDAPSGQKSIGRELSDRAIRGSLGPDGYQSLVYPMTIESGDEKWKATVRTNPENKYQWFVDVVNKNDHIPKEILVPKTEGDTWEPSPIGFFGNSTKFYFLMITGSTDSRGYDLFQLDPIDGTVKNVGYTNGRVFLKNGNWIVWEKPWSVRLDGHFFHTTALVAFNLSDQKNYVLTDGKYISLFNKWK